MLLRRARSRRPSRAISSSEPLEQRTLLTAMLSFDFDLITSDLHPTDRFYGKEDEAPATVIRYGKGTAGSFENLPGLAAITSPEDLTFEFGSDDINAPMEALELSNFDDGLSDGLADHIYEASESSDPTVTFFHEGNPVARGELMSLHFTTTEQGTTQTPDNNQSMLKVTEPLGDDPAIYQELLAASGGSGEIALGVAPIEPSDTWDGATDGQAFDAGAEFEDVVVPPVQVLDDGQLKIAGTTGSDVINVSQTETEVIVKYNGTEYRKQIAAGSVRSFAITEMEIRGSEGNDQIRHLGANTIPTRSYGEAGNDSLIGGAAGDYLDGGDGADSLVGNQGPDTIVGGAGSDILKGGADGDSLLGEGGGDTLLGGSGRDSIHGSGGDDSLHGGSGPDQLYGDSGKDFLKGSRGADVLNGGTEDDTLKGGGGSDTLFGETGKDSLDGQSNNDLLLGDSGDDTLTGGSGRDVLVGGLGKDSLVGGQSADVLIAHQINLTDGNLRPLEKALQRWTATSRTYTERVQSIRNQLSESLVADGTFNFIFGVGGDDFFMNFEFELQDLEQGELFDEP